MQVDFGNVQATVVHRYKCPIARHLIFRFDDRDGARAFLRELTPRVTMADFQFESTPDPLLNLGLTFDGLVALGVDPELLEDFDFFYQKGPEPLRTGDAPGSRSDPVNWWEGQFKTEDVHCITHLYFRSDDAVEPATETIRTLARESGVTELIPREDGTVLDAHVLGDSKVHFGYTDGISQLDICWDDLPGTLEQTNRNFRNFLLGYATPDWGSAPARGPAADLARDGTYAAFRWVYQDVATFNQFLRTEGPRLFPDLTPADAEELLAAKMMGRWRDGTPLVLSPEHADSAMARRDDFGYATEDPEGYQCPFSAHMRVVNPRDQPLDPIVVGGVPRVIRRGMPYGPVLDSTDDDGLDRGIIGIFLCADIRRQIYTLAGWIKQNNFSPVFNPNRRAQDALVGNRAVVGASAEFALPAPGGGAIVTGLPDFVHTKGTVFLLLPSKSALQQLAGES